MRPRCASLSYCARAPHSSPQNLLDLIDVLDDGHGLLLPKEAHDLVARAVVARRDADEWNARGASRTCIVHNVAKVQQLFAGTARRNMEKTFGLRLAEGYVFGADDGVEADGRRVAAERD